MQNTAPPQKQYNIIQGPLTNTGNHIKDVLDFLGKNGMMYPEHVQSEASIPGLTGLPCDSYRCRGCGRTQKIVTDTRVIHADEPIYCNCQDNNKFPAEFKPL